MRRIHIKPQVNQSHHIQAVIGDWSGTFADKYCMVPVIGMRNAFKKSFIHVTNEEIRKHMGLPKREHIKKILSEKGHSYSSPNVEQKIYDDFNNELETDDMLPLFNATRYTRQILKYLRNYYGIKVGVTTGFTFETSERIMEHVLAEGVELDTHVGSNSVVHGSRPLPFMIWKCMDILNIQDTKKVVKIGDSDLDMKEGKNAGCWTVGIYGYSTHLNVSDPDTPYHTLENQRQKAKKILEQSGADYTIENMSMIPQVIDHINQRIDNVQKILRMVDKK